MDEVPPSGHPAAAEQLYADMAAYDGNLSSTSLNTTSTIGADPNLSSDAAEEKRLKRMRRNRESAAQSRNRKKQYVEELEAQVQQLEDAVNGLHNENCELRREQG